MEIDEKSVSDQLAYDFIEDGPIARDDRFMDFVWQKFRNQMRVMILAYVEGEGADEFRAYLNSMSGVDEDTVRGGER